MTASRIMIYPTDVEKSLFHYCAKLKGHSLSQFIIDIVNNEINDNKVIPEPKEIVDKTIVLIPNHLLSQFKEHTTDISQFLIDSAMSYITIQQAPAPVPKHDDGGDTKLLEDYIMKLEGEIRGLKQPVQSQNIVDRMVDKIYDHIKSVKGRFVKEDDLRELFTVETEQDNDNFYIALDVFQKRHMEMVDKNDEPVIEYSSKTHGWRMRK